MECVICKEPIWNIGEGVVLREKGANGINKASKERGDVINVTAGQSVHKNCRANFTKPQNIAAAARETSQARGKRVLRSEAQKFNFKEHCLFCGEGDQYQGKKKDFVLVPVRTFEFQETVSEICNERNDEWARKVSDTIESAIDLHAADALYHQKCSVNFRTRKEIPLVFTSSQEGAAPQKKTKRGRPLEEVRNDAFERVVEFFEQNDEEQLAVKNLVEKMADFLQESETTPYSAIYMKKRIKERFGDDVIFTELDGRPDVVTMRPLAAKILQKFYNEPKKENIKEEEMRFVKTAATCLKNDIKSCPTSKEHYASNSDLSSVENALSFLPESLVLLLDTVLVGKDKKCKIASIGQAIMQAARPRALIAPLQLGLGVQMHHHFGSRFLVDSLHRHGFCCSYSEVQAYERSAAIKDGVELSIPDGETLVQYVADNVDHNIRTIDGRNTFHGMRIIATITPRNTARPSIFIPRRCNMSSDEIAAIGAINIKQYNIASSLQLNIRYDQLLPTEIVDPTSNLDLLWQVSWLLNPRRPSWSGTMQSCHQGEYPGKSSVIFLPMIELDPSNVTCVYSTLDFVSRHARRYDVTPILTFDQPLWWKATCIIKGEPTDSPLRQIILRLGAFHTEMSFLGSIGHLMRGSGLQEALELIYADNVVPHMLSGKAISRAVRGHLLVETALNTILLSKAYDVPLPTEGERQQDRVKDSNTKDEAKEAQERDRGAETAAESETEEMHTDLKGVKDILESLMQGKTSMEYVCQSHDLEDVRWKILEAKSSVSNSRTGKLWLQYLEMIEILRTFIKAERTGDWNLHLQTVQAMLPYFAASGHNLYTKSSRIYLQEMGKLKNDHPHVHDAFQKGFHVIRRSDRYWAGLSSDLIIEQVLMRSLKTSGGLTRGRGMSETQRLIWLLSMPATAEINEATQEFTEVTFSSSEQHKDTSEARISRDMKDTKSLLSFFEERDPFSDDCSLRNIATGVTAIDTVNADVAKEVGNKILEKMTEQYCKDFVFKRASQAITLDASKHSKATDGDMHVDPQLLFQRLFAVKGYANEDTSNLFSYELCSVPASLFETNGLLREANKPVLASAIRKLVDTEVEIPSQPLKYVLDGAPCFNDYLGSVEHRMLLLSIVIWHM